MKNRGIKRIIKKRIEINNSKKIDKVVPNPDRYSNTKKKKYIGEKKEKKNINIIKPPKVTNISKVESKPIIVIDKNKKNKIETPKGLKKHQARDFERSGVTPKLSIGQRFIGVDYIKKEQVDYDIIFCIGSYDRYEKVTRLINQIYSQKTEYTFKVIVYNDGSNDKRYNFIATEFKDIDYIKMGQNNGKIGYHKTITTLWNRASNYKAHTICHIDDDFILCDGFIDELMRTFFRVKRVKNNIISVYYHKTAKENNQEVDHFRVDGGVMFDYDFVQALNFTIPRPTQRQYSNGISSGVWRYVSEQIRGNKLISYRMNISLVKHDGNEDSKMHYKHRLDAPIHSYHFKDDLEKND